MNRDRATFLAATLGLIALDQLVKAWARAAAEGVEGRVFAVVWNRVFELKLVYNDGVAFGMLQGAGLLLTPLAAAIAVGAGVSVWRGKHPGRLHAWVCAMLAAGALGNMVDRLRFGRVTDMFYVRAINFPVFNVADVCISLAAVALVLGTFVRREAPAEESATPAPPPA